MEKTSLETAASSQFMAVLTRTSLWLACPEPAFGCPDQNQFMAVLTSSQFMAVLPRTSVWLSCPEPVYGCPDQNRFMAVLPKTTLWLSCEEPFYGCSAKNQFMAFWTCCMAESWTTFGWLWPGFEAIWPGDLRPVFLVVLNHFHVQWDYQSVNQHSPGQEGCTEYTVYTVQCTV